MRKTEQLKFTKLDGFSQENLHYINLHGRSSGYYLPKIQSHLAFQFNDMIFFIPKLTIESTMRNFCRKKKNSFV